ncbi:ribosome recycling factor [Aspergillus ellipticus CBS 707.79]|uniref:Ribosome recycling factor n=1 Tax=Aspergillus ellipticus CBS 707.79 TaxID=1448320 RepID=A0A319DPR0_9EURO|nr:ribosome recycling factor [Aspergillus ellipticus CBS 707.79]
MQRFATITGLSHTYWACSRSFLLPLKRQIPRWSQRTLAAPNRSQSFSNTSFLYKKKDKAKAIPDSHSGTALSKTGAAPENPYDFSQLNDGIAGALRRLQDDLSGLRVGGRFNTELIENLRVQLSKGSKEMLRLRDLAQVIPKGGRIVTIWASEEDHMKPITSSIISSNLSLTPQPDCRNALQLNISIPPPTKESRDQTIAMAKVAMEKAVGAVRDSRAVVHKRLQDLQKKKIARPDDIRKAQEQMEKLTEKGQKDVKDLFEATKRVMERAQ